MRHFMAAMLASVTILSANVGAAQTNPVVVELYTSQGCSSCPPADEMMRTLAGRDDIIALSLHVDYWDYIGWKDVFGSPAFTRRQHGYANAANARTVYTPQFIIGGADFVVGAKSMELMDAVAAQRPSGIALNLSRSGNQLRIAAAPGRGGRDMVVQVVRYTPEEQVAIQRGENAGRTIAYSNIVTSWDVVGQWNGRSALDMTTPVSGTSPIVVIVQDAAFGPIMAAARLR